MDDYRSHPPNKKSRRRKRDWKRFKLRRHHCDMKLAFNPGNGVWERECECGRTA